MRTGMFRLPISKVKRCSNRGKIYLIQTVNFHISRHDCIASMGEMYCMIAPGESATSHFNGYFGPYSQFDLIFRFLINFRPRKQIWHGSNINGDKSIESFCGTWESITPDKTGMAGSLSYRRLINNEKVSCRDELIVLCIETIPREEVPAN